MCAETLERIKAIPWFSLDIASIMSCETTKNQLDEEAFGCHFVRYENVTINLGIFFIHMFIMHPIKSAKVNIHHTTNM